MAEKYTFPPPIIPTRPLPRPVVQPMPKSGEMILRALAAGQSSGFNASPFSQFINDAGTEAGGKLSRGASAIASALALPGEVLSGQTPFDPRLGFSGQDPATLNRAADIAGVVGLGSLPLPRPRGSLGMGGANFDRWFGNSQVRNPDGSPMTVYHGTTGNFDTFRVPTDGAGNPRAVYFTPDPSVASQYAAGKGSVMPAYVKAENLLTVDLKGGATDALGRSREAIVRQARADGYDGVLLKNTGDVGGIQDQYAVFNPAQIKSATGNSGGFNPADPSIVRLSGVPLIPVEQNRER
jgi:hypothetical protein